MSLRQLRRKHLIFVIVLGIAISFVIAATTLFSDSLYPVSALPQQKERLLHRLPIEKGEPIVITDIKVNGNSISFDQKFEAGDDWLKSLVFSVKNRSDKPILLISLFLHFPRVPGSLERTSVHEMYFGNRELAARKPTPQERIVGLAPGQTVNLQLTSQQFEGLRSFLFETGYSSSIEKVEFQIYRVLFEDDTMWSGGGIFQRDEGDSGTWSRQKPYGLSKLGRADSVIWRRGVTTRRFHGAHSTDAGHWTLRHPSVSQVEQLFSHASVA